MRRRLAIPAVLALALAAGAGLAADEGRGRIAELKTIFIQASSQKEPAPGTPASLYPPGARQFGVEGNVLLRCAVAPQDKFSDCEVMEEEPKGKGFAASAMLAATLVRQHIEVRKDERAVALLPFSYVLEESKRQEWAAGDVVWEKRPNADEMTRAYPDRALRESVGGWAILGCSIKADGWLENCRVYDEWPHGYGFKEAAISLVGRFKMGDHLKDGRSVAGGRIEVPVTFKLP